MSDIQASQDLDNSMNIQEGKGKISTTLMLKREARKKTEYIKRHTEEPNATPL